MFHPVDPNKDSLYDSGVKLVKIGSKAMSEHTDAVEILSDDENPTQTVRQFLTKLEYFLDETLDESTRGNVFMAENGDGVSLNIVVGATFASNHDEEINQINISVLPTDRSLLGSEGVSINSGELEDEEDYPEDDFDEDAPF